MFNLLPGNSNYLYYMIEGMRASLEPARFANKMMRELLDNRNNPFFSSKSAQNLRASLEMLERITREYKKPSFGIRESGC